MKLVLALCLGAASAFQARAPPLTESYAVDQLTAPSSAPQAPTKIGASQIANVVKPLVAAGVLTVALPAFAADVDAGEQVFSGNCAACHAGGQNVIMPEKTLEKDALTEFLAGGFNEGAVKTQVTNGKNAMPAFGGRLSNDDIANVAAYVIQSANDGW